MHHPYSSVYSCFTHRQQGAQPVLSSIPVPGAGQPQRFAMLAVGCKAGIVWLWRYSVPHQYSPSGSPSSEAFTLVPIFA